MVIPPVQAAARPPSSAATTTLQQFLHMQHVDAASHATFVRPTSAPPVPLAKSDLNAPHQTLPSASPATMKPITQALPSNTITFTGQATRSSGAGTVSPLTLHSSDQRVELQLPPASVDLSHTPLAASTSKNPRAYYTCSQSQSVAWIHHWSTQPDWDVSDADTGSDRGCTTWSSPALSAEIRVSLSASRPALA